MELRRFLLERRVKLDSETSQSIDQYMRHVWRFLSALLRRTGEDESKRGKKLVLHFEADVRGLPPLVRGEDWS